MLNLRLTVNPDGTLTLEDAPAGVAIVALLGGTSFSLQVDPLVAHNLQGSKRQLAALRQQLAVDRQPRERAWEDDRRRMTDTLMKVTMTLSGMLEAYDWVLNAPNTGLTDDGRAKLRALFLSAVPAARSAVQNVGTLDIDWEQVVSGRKLDDREATGPGVWATMARELAPMVNGPEGAALVATLDEMNTADAENVYRLDDSEDWLHTAYIETIRAAGACRGLMEDEAQKEVGTRFYRGYVSAALNLGRALAIRQLMLVPEPPVTKQDPYLQCGDCLSPKKCEVDRRCARVGERAE